MPALLEAEQVVLHAGRRREGWKRRSSAPDRSASRSASSRPRRARRPPRRSRARRWRGRARSSWLLAAPLEEAERASIGRAERVPSPPEPDQRLLRRGELPQLFLRELDVADGETPVERRDRVPSEKPARRRRDPSRRGSRAPGSSTRPMRAAGAPERRAPRDEAPRARGRRALDPCRARRQVTSRRGPRRGFGEDRRDRLEASLDRGVRVPVPKECEDVLAAVAEKLMPGARASGQPRPGARARGDARPGRVDVLVESQADVPRRTRAAAESPVHPRVQSSLERWVSRVRGKRRVLRMERRQELLGCAVSSRHRGRACGAARAVRARRRHSRRGRRRMRPCRLEGKGAHGRCGVRERVELLAEGLVERRSPEQACQRPSPDCRRGGRALPRAEQRRAVEHREGHECRTAERAAVGSRSASSSPSESLRASTPDPRCDIPPAAAAASRCRGPRPSAARLRRGPARGRSRRPARGARAWGRGPWARGQFRTRTHKHRCDARRSAEGRRRRATSPSHETRRTLRRPGSPARTAHRRMRTAPPLPVTCSTRLVEIYASSSRFGPTEPVEPAARKCGSATAYGTQRLPHRWRRRRYRSRRHSPPSSSR